MKELMQRVKLHAHEFVDDEKRDLEYREAELKVVHLFLMSLEFLKFIWEDILDLVVILALLKLL